jgi:hypothetical protein
MSCSKKEKTGSLYAIDSLLTAQVKYLTEQKATLTKVTLLGGKEDKVSLTPKDSAAWKNELEIFATMDMINKPTNKVYYQADDLSDIRSNLNVKAFSTKEDLPIRYLRVYYHEDISKLRKLEAEFNELNSLYKSSRMLVMEFQQMGNNVVLTSYEIVGGQKMFLGDSVQYNIKGTLSISN